MGNRSRIPSSIFNFDNYLGTTDDYLLAGAPETNAVRLGILESEQQSWHNFRLEWTPLFPVYENKHSSRTMLVTEQLKALMKQVKAFDKEHQILNRIAASPNATVADLAVFNIKSGLLAKNSRSKPSNPIDTLVVPQISQIGGGELAIRCRNNEDSRCAIIDEANSVEYRYLLGDTPPESPVALELLNGLSTRASCTLNLGAENAGKTAYLYFRWYNTKYPSLAGPWSRLYSILLV